MGQKIFPVHLVVEQVETVVRLFLRFLVQLPLKHPDLQWCFQAHRQSPLLSFFKSTSEVRVLPSAGITRLPRSYDPFRLPDWPSSYRERWRCDLHQRRISPNDSDHLSYMPCSLPRWSERCVSVSFPVRAAFPNYLVGRHPRRHFRGLLKLHSRSGLKVCSPAYGGLLSRGSSPASYPT